MNCKCRATTKEKSNLNKDILQVLQYERNILNILNADIFKKQFIALSSTQCKIKRELGNILQVINV